MTDRQLIEHLVRANRILSEEFQNWIAASRAVDRDYRELRQRIKELRKERDTLLAERDRHSRSMQKARSTIHSSVTRRAFDEVYRRAMGSK